ncbi:N-acetyltransferase [Neisseria chenwenguii]|uniref:N-acetyltransferase n=1 Tax=Neisseria chenwenguii TaxID=1853278 RepID=A0A220S427_9NEIS|nr:GNAT family N-acetyltransferase [Neisseria chenwenguii]ASK28261.1 N-acetyltransferase [Neisseria chenwenguii]
MNASHPQTLVVHPLKAENREWFIRSLQQAFRQAFQDELAENEEIISREEIETCMQGERAQYLQIEAGGSMVGGAVVNINPQTKHNGLELFFICSSRHGQGFGQQAWKLIEQRYPQTRVWETHTPYFEKRNIHFYLKCGFKIVEFYAEQNPAPDKPGNGSHAVPDEMFRFEKEMK